MGGSRIMDDEGWREDSADRNVQPEGPQVDRNNDERPVAVVAASAERIANGPTDERRPVGRFKQRKKSRKLSAGEAFFLQKLAQAQEQLGKIGEILEALAGKLDAARLRQAVEIEAEGDAIEDLIWEYNDAVQNARAAWLRGEVSGDAYDRLVRLETPSDLHVPAFTDRPQASVAREQEEQIGQRLGRRTQALARILAAIKVLEGPAPGVLLPIGGGVVVTSVQTTGPWSVVMYVPSAKGFPYAAPVTTAGADTLGGVPLASTIISWWLRTGRPRRIARKPTPLPDAPKPPAPTAKAPPSPRPPRRDAGSHDPGVFDAGDARPVQYVHAKPASAIGLQRETDEPPTLVWSQRLLKSPEPTIDGAFGFTMRVANTLHSRTLNRLAAGAQSITATKVVSFGLLLDAEGVPRAKISTEVVWRLDINNIGNRKLPVRLDDTVALRGRKRYAALIQIAYKLHGVRRSTADPLKTGTNTNVLEEEYTAAIEKMAASRMETIIKYVYLDKERLDKADEATRTGMEKSIAKILPKLGELPNKLEALEYRGLGAWWYKDGRKGSRK